MDIQLFGLEGWPMKFFLDWSRYPIIRFRQILTNSAGSSNVEKETLCALDLFAEDDKTYLNKIYLCLNDVWRFITFAESNHKLKKIQNLILIFEIVRYVHGIFNEFVNYYNLLALTIA